MGPKRGAPWGLNVGLMEPKRGADGAVRQAVAALCSGRGSGDLFGASVLLG